MKFPNAQNVKKKSASFTDTLAKQESKETHKEEETSKSYQSHNFCQFQSKAISFCWHSKCNFREDKEVHITRFSNEIFVALVKKKNSCFIWSINRSEFFHLFKNFLKFHFGFFTGTYLHIIIYLIFVAFLWELWIVSSTKLHPLFVGRENFSLFSKTTGNSSKQTFIANLR